MSIKLCGRRFSKPVRLAGWNPLCAPLSALLSAPGIYALLVQDCVGYRVIYIGETENLSTLRVDRRHPAWPCWVVIAGSVRELYVSACLASGLSPGERKALAGELVAAVRPLCNYEARSNPPSPPRSSGAASSSQRERRNSQTYALTSGAEGRGCFSAARGLGEGREEGGG